ncbi:MAG: GNAT family N-acetyltransferase [Actinomycetota bacterium]|nr:GNAT family N-acetyltransferase [Actinomycetota bacterium]
MDRIATRIPTPEEYAELRRAVDWPVPARPDIERALAGTYAGACAAGVEGIIGMGRLITDGAFYWYIVDVVVRPEHQSRGVGTGIMRALEVVVSQRSTTGVANLVANADVIAFYERLGYEDSGSLLMGKAVPAPCD